MPTPIAEIITEKLLKMRKYLKELKSIKPVDYNTYLQNLTSRYAVERLMQLIVDLALDINNVILSHKGKPAAVDYFNSFIELADCHVLDADFASQIAPSTGLRNRLVHEYEKVDNKIVFKSIDKTIEMYGRYIQKVKRVLENCDN